MREHRRLLPLVPLIVGLWGMSAGPVRAQQNTPAPQLVAQPTITVEGEASIQVKPDIARFVVTVQTVEKDVTTAVAENSKRAEAVQKALRDAGVAEKDIQTVNYSLYPRYEPDPEKPNTVGKLVGYAVDNGVRVTVRRIADAGKLLDVATKAGANSAGNLSFGLSDEIEEKARQEALTLAVGKARIKAVTIAKAAKAGAIRLFRIAEGGGDGGPLPPPMPMMQARMANTPISTGELSVRVVVTVQYTFNPDLPANYD